ncbi:hypothetical protein [Agrobacterium sp. CG674]
MRRTKAAQIYKKTGNLRAVQILLGHTKLESTVRYLGVEVDDALRIAEQNEVKLPDQRREPVAALRQKRLRQPSRSIMGLFTSQAVLPLSFTYYAKEASPRVNHLHLSRAVGCS